MPNVNENTIFKVCNYLRNWFDRGQAHFTGEIQISNGALTETYGLKAGQYFRIIGSSNNDGVYQYPVTALTDETFNGSIWGMAIPAAFISILKKIEDYEAEYGNVTSAAFSPYSSESFDGYSRSGGGAGTKDTAQDSGGTWIGTFGAELAPWRKM